MPPHIRRRSRRREELGPCWSSSGRRRPETGDIGDEGVLDGARRSLTFSVREVEEAGDGELTAAVLGGGSGAGELGPGRWRRSARVRSMHGRRDGAEVDGAVLGGCERRRKRRSRLSSTRGGSARCRGVRTEAAELGVEVEAPMTAVGLGKEDAGEGGGRARGEDGRRPELAWRAGGREWRRGGDAGRRPHARGRRGRLCSEEEAGRWRRGGSPACVCFVCVMCLVWLLCACK